jgi:hypothetical protein
VSGSSREAAEKEEEEGGVRCGSEAKEGEAVGVVDVEEDAAALPRLESPATAARNFFSILVFLIIILEIKPIKLFF